ncbi:cobamide remodeling phosphodiesterase CbiR [Desulfovibrio cuneatus]|uniref:cobamide remodeling phosphodiesterase CbiR n=1 Tax=Desulfovibrio cuneatus TaxID=159728 RepID=UPI0012EB9706|nr:cobamide remodeling phosphodiesterase CbiR [Desulfovibrio cuneatus]
MAAPSWVMPGSVLENCQVLAPLADEVGILFFETEASLAAGAAELPPELAAFPLSYHVHLPVDLPMHQPEKAATIAATLVQKLAFLGVQRAVVHPPAGKDAPRLVQRFVQAFVACCQGVTLLWENTKENSLLEISPVLLALNQRICLDIGHLLAYEQENLLLAPALLAQVDMVHINAPGEGGQRSRHACLSTLTPAQEAVAKAALVASPPQAVLMFELFRWQEVEKSVPLVRQWLNSAS